MPRCIAPLFLVALLTLPLTAEELTLPRVGTIGDAPASARTVVVTVERDGTIRVGKKELRFRDLRRVLRDAGAMHRGERRVSGANVLLRIDRRAPWIATQWILIACAQGRIARVFHGVLPESGDTEGAMAWFLPADKGLADPNQDPEEVLGLMVRIGFDGTGVDPAALYPLLMEIPAKHRKDAVLDLRAVSNVPHGFALAVADVAMRAGIQNVEIYGTAIPPEDADLKALVRKHAPPEGTPSIRLDDVVVPAAKVKLPPVTRVRGKVAGHAPEPFDPENEEIEEEEIEEQEFEEEEMEDEEFEEEEIEETPIETDGIDDDGDFEDEPFTGPSSNAPIGVGRNKRKVSRAQLRKSAPAAATENAVDRGLAWLAAAQDAKTGGWHSPDGKHDVAVSGLAVMAFLGGGHTDRGSESENPYVGTVQRGLRYLMNQQKKDGSFGAGNKAIYDAAIAALTLSDAYWITRHPAYKKPAQHALDFLSVARNPLSGWGHGVRSGSSNTAVTAWCVMALRAGRSAGLVVDPDSFAGADQWVARVTDEKSGRAGYDKKGGGVFRPKELADKFPADKSRAMTAAAVLTRIFLGQDPRKSAVVRKGAAECLKRPPVWNTQDGSIDMSYWYFGTLALFQIGGNPWRTWNRAMKAAIVESQNKVGTKEAGSWDPIGPWGAFGGRVYSTALMTVCLEIYYS